MKMDQDLVNRWKDTIEETISNRQEYNREIVKILGEMVEKYPDMRFGQILNNFANINNDPFYIESKFTLKSLKDAQMVE